MKKEYLIPEMEIITLGLQPLLAGSPMISITPDEEPATPPGGSDAPGLDVEDVLGIGKGMPF